MTLTLQEPRNILGLDENEIESYVSNRISLLDSTVEQQIIMDTGDLF